VGVAHRDADLSDATQSLFDQSLMTGMERLVASDEQRGRLLRVERRAKQRQRTFGPEFRRAVGGDVQTDVVGCDEHPVGVFEPASFDAVDPDHKGLAEGGARLRRRADEIGDHGAAGLDHPVAHPTHAARMLHPILVAEAEIAGEIGANRVGVEHHRVEERRQRGRQRRLAGAGKSHDQNFALHAQGPI